MARIGNRAIEVPKGVEVKIDKGMVTVKGAKNSLSLSHLPAVTVALDQGKIVTSCQSNDQLSRSLQGLYNSLLNNMILGVTKGFEKELDLVGVGYRAQLQGKKLQLSLGYSHPIEYDPPTGIEFEVAGGTRIKIKGADKQKVGQVAAEIRQIRKVEPYKGKGVRYVGEIVRKKAGKAA